MSNETEWVLVQKEKLEKVADGIFSKHHSAKENKDAYDVGYFGAMLRDVEEMLAAAPQPPAEAQRCTCPSGDGSLRCPCPAHPPEAQPVYVGVDLEGGWIRATTPPSAPVGVEAIIVDMERWIRAVEASGPYAAGRTVVVQEWVKQLRALAQQPAAVDDSALLDALARESWKLDPFDMPTPGGDDADVGWRVIEYHRDHPCEREVAVHYGDDPRAALRAALAAQQGENNDDR